MSQITSDVESVSSLVSSSLGGALSATVGVVGGLLQLAGISTQLLGATVCIVPPVVLFFLACLQREEALSRRTKGASTELTTAAAEALTQLLTLQALAWRRHGGDMAATWRRHGRDTVATWW